MSMNPRLNRRRQFWLVLVIVQLVGCAHIRLPAIDPTGQRILLPPPNYTTLDNPCRGRLGPTPAFTEPPAIPPCPRPGVPLATTQPALVAGPTVPDRLIITPSRIVAPVGSEVVLLAGLSGSDGQYLTKQPIEWLMSQESVGHFVAVPQEDHACLAKLLHHDSRKLSVGYAQTRSSTEAATLTRGTPATTDDIWLQKGQSWVSLTSVSEGTSNITAVATGAENWDQRRQTATVQWIDAQWQLPSPAVAPAGNPHALTTVITRTTDGSPVANWIVRYTVLSGPSVSLGPENAQSADVPTDINGQATVSLQPYSTEPGVSQVRIDILSPSLRGRDGQAVVVGSGTTTVTWSAPGLAVDVSGPATAALNANVTYQITVSNPGDIPVQEATVTAQIPSTLRILSADPPATPLGGSLRWTLASLGPRETRQLRIDCQTVRAGDIRVFARATAGNLSAEDSTSTSIVESAITLSMSRADGQTGEVRVGDEVSYNITVTNNHFTGLNNVTIRDTFDAGLRHRDEPTSPIEKSLGFLPAGASEGIQVTFVVQQAGQWCHTIEVFSDEGHTASARECVTAIDTRPALSVRILGPAQATVNDVVRYTAEVSNGGNVPVTGVGVDMRVDAALLPQDASHDHERFSENDFRFTVPSLAPGEVATRSIRCECIRPAEAAIIEVTVSSDQGITASDRMQSRIAAAAGPPAVVTPPPAATAPPPATTTGGLDVSIDTFNNTAQVGEQLVYSINIANTRQIGDRNVDIQFILSEGLAFVDLSTQSLELSPRISPDRRSIALPLYPEILANDVFPQMRLQVEATAAGRQSVRVEVRSANEPQGVSDQVETAVAGG